MPTLKLLLILFIIFFISSCSNTQIRAITETFYLTVNNSRNKLAESSKQISMQLKRLITHQQQAKGLMFQPYLQTNTGVILEYQTEAKRGIWMKNMLNTIDVIFLNRNGKITRLIENLTPCPSNKACPIHYANHTQLIIELPAGFIKQNEITTGNSYLELPK
jgi:uncharacterized membrane protein (UPF0127 family)